MFKDIILYIDNDKIDYEYKIDKYKIYINTITKLEKGKVLKIYFKENIYEINLDNSVKFTKGKSDEIFINLNNDTFSFSVILKSNFFAKSVYEFLNKLIDKEQLIDEIKLFINSKAGKKYKSDLKELLELIENKERDLEELIISNEDDNERISNLLLKNNTYLDIMKNMSDLDLMLLITSYIFMYIVPEITQEKFDNLVMTAKNYDYALENVWRLGMNYDERGYNFDLLDDFFVNSKDVWYLTEYISGVIQVNKEKVVNKIIETNDKKFIRSILEYDIFTDKLCEEYKVKMEKSLN